MFLLGDFYFFVNNVDLLQYNENEIKLEFEQAEWVDLSEYSPSSIWDVMDAPAALVNKRSRIEFQVRIR